MHVGYGKIQKKVSKDTSSPKGGKMFHNRMLSGSVLVIAFTILLTTGRAQAKSAQASLEDMVQEVGWSDLKVDPTTATISGQVIIPEELKGYLYQVLADERVYTVTRFIVAIRKDYSFSSKTVAAGKYQMEATFLIPNDHGEQQEISSPRSQALIVPLITRETVPVYPCAPMDSPTMIRPIGSFEQGVILLPDGRRYDLDREIVYLRVSSPSFKGWIDPRSTNIYVFAFMLDIPDQFGDFCPQ